MARDMPEEEKSGGGRNCMANDALGEERSPGPRVRLLFSQFFPLLGTLASHAGDLLYWANILALLMSVQLPTTTGLA